MDIDEETDDNKPILEKEPQRIEKSYRNTSFNLGKNRLHVRKDSLLIGKYSLANGKFKYLYVVLFIE